MHFEIDDVAPACHPLIQQLGVVCFHKLVAAFKLLIHPTGKVGETLRREASLVAESSIHGDGVATVEVFDHHVERLGHVCSYRSVRLSNRYQSSAETCADCGPASSMHAY